MISVVIPVYNVEKYLRTCIESVIAQTYKDIEIILVDDCGGDGSAAIMEEYWSVDPRIQIIKREKNGGLSAARNSGIDAAKGEYIYLLDADDAIHPKTLEIMHRVMTENEDLSIVVASHQCFYDDNMPEYPGRIEADVILRTGEDFLLEAGVDKEDVMFIDGITAWGKLYKRELFEGRPDLDEAPIRYPEGRLHEDEFVTYRLIYPAANVAYIRAALYQYRRRTGSITAVEGEKARADRIAALMERLVYYKAREAVALQAQTADELLEKTILHCMDLKNEGVDKAKLAHQQRCYDTVYTQDYKPLVKEGLIDSKNKYKLFYIAKGLYGLLYKLKNKK